MNKVFTIVFLLVSISSTLKAQSGNTYAGNKASGFGGGIGNSFLTITDNSTTVFFEVSSPVNFGPNALVLYLDTKIGGVANTSTLSDRSDRGRTAISGSRDQDTRTTATFPTNFFADYAISIEPYSFAGIFDISNPSNFQFLESANLTTTGNGTGGVLVKFNVPKLKLGLIAASSFSFVGTLISTDAYRSNETFGTSTTAFNAGENSDPSVNARYTGTTTFSTSFSFNYTALPLKLVSFSGKNANSQVTLDWTTTHEVDVQHFVIEGSTNGTAWSSLSSVAAKNTTTARYTQTFTDTANTFFRLKVVNKDGKISYSPVVNLKTSVRSINLMNNPVAGVIRLSINTNANKYMATLYSMDGKAVAGKTYNHPGGISTLELPVTHLAKGNYILRVANGPEVKSLQVMLD